MKVSNNSIVQNNFTPQSKGLLNGRSVTKGPLNEQASPTTSQRIIRAAAVFTAACFFGFFLYQSFSSTQSQNGPSSTGPKPPETGEKPIDPDYIPFFDDLTVNDA